MKKIISLLLMVILTVSMVPTIAFASPTEACDGYEIQDFNGSLACVDANHNLHICEKNFPDANFREAVKVYDINSDGVLSAEEVNAVISISVYGKSLTDLYIITNLEL